MESIDPPNSVLESVGLRNETKNWKQQKKVERKK